MAQSRDIRFDLGELIDDGTTIISEEIASVDDQCCTHGIDTISVSRYELENGSQYRVAVCERCGGYRVIYFAV